MKCHNIQKKLSAYQDRELEPQEQEQIGDHLLSCLTCHKQYVEFERVWQTLGELEEIRPDPWFYQQLIKRIKKPREGRWIPRLQWAFRLLPVPVIVSILLVIGLLAGTYLGNILARFDLLPFRHVQTRYTSEEITLTSLKVFDPVPPSTLADGYLQMVSYKESESR